VAVVEAWELVGSGLVGLAQTVRYVHIEWQLKIEGRDVEFQHGLTPSLSLKQR
jgi:hypothetical protein